jgi:hypothetical protein
VTATPPHAVAVEVVAARPAGADEAAIAHLRRTTDHDIPPVAHLVLVRLEAIPPATSSGYALYVGNFRVPKYWQYRDGIYFKVYDPQFFAEHAGEPLRFSANGMEFIETGLALTIPDLTAASGPDAGDLPEQSDILS